MKKLLLLSLILCIGMVGVSQNKATIKNVKMRHMGSDVERFDRATDDATNFYNPVSTVRSTGACALSEHIIGYTWYDLLGNYNTTGNRFWRFDDGTMAGVWTMGFEAPNFTDDRGTGYNYYNGTEWGPTPEVRVEDTRTGWPNITAWGDGEIGVAHNGNTSLEIIQREAKGTGEWTQTNFLGPVGAENALTWPRISSSGDNNEVTHIFANSNGAWLGQGRTDLYSRSEDGGDTWDPHNIVIPGTGEDYYLEITQDLACFASRGNTICFLYTNQLSDLFYMRSDDNGFTWEIQIVWEHPIPFYSASDPLDSCFIPDNSGHMCIDYEGHAHVVFGITRFVSDGGGANYMWDNPKNDGIVYWNDMMEPFSNDLNALAPPIFGFANSEMIEDVNYIGWMQDVDGDGVVSLEGAFEIRSDGMSTMPTITVDEQGQRFVVWSANTETYVYNPGPDGVNLKHIWARAYANSEWGEFMDVTADIAHLLDDCVYPMLASSSDANIHYIYQADFAPGNAIDGPQEFMENRWIYGMLPKSELITGISEKEVIDDSHVSQNFPNPFSTVSTVNVKLEETANLSLVVTNMTGQKVIEINKGQVPAQNHTFTIDASKLQSGIYFYTVTAGTSQVTRKMIVE
jgi:hypothetical protein